MIPAIGKWSAVGPPRLSQGSQWGHLHRSRTIASAKDMLCSLSLTGRAGGFFKKTVGIVIIKVGLHLNFVLHAPQCDLESHAEPSSRESPACFICGEAESDRVQAVTLIGCTNNRGQ